jgi:glutaminase
MVNSGSIIINSLLQTLMKPEMSGAEKFDEINNYIKRMAGDEFVSFNNSVYLAEREVSDRNYALAYYMKENKCFPKGSNIKDCIDFWYQVQQTADQIICQMTKFNVHFLVLCNGG